MSILVESVIIMDIVIFAIFWLPMFLIDSDFALAITPFLIVSISLFTVIMFYLFNFI
jgi:hypothetical protein